MADNSYIFQRKNERDIYIYGLNSPCSSCRDIYGRDESQGGYIRREDLQTFWTDYDSHISDLSDQYQLNGDFHSEELHTTRTELLQAQDKIYQLRQENDKLQRNREMLENELKKSKEELDKAHKSRENVFNLNCDLDTKRVSSIVQLKHSKSKLQEQVDNLHIEKQQLGADLRREKMNLNISEKKNKRLQEKYANEIKSLESANKRLRNEYENKMLWLQKENEELCSALRQARQHGNNEKTEMLQIEIKHMRREREREHGYLEPEKRSYARKPEYVKSQNLVESTEENKSITASKELLGKLDKENSELKYSVLQLQKANTNLTIDLRNKSVSENTESFKNSRLREENKELQDEVGVLKRKILSLKRDLNQEKEKAEKIKKDDKERQLCEKISELEHKVEQLSNEKKELIEDLRHARNTINKNGNFENSKLIEKNHNLQKEVKALHHEIQNLNEKIMSEKENVKIKEKECRHLQQTMDTINEEKILNERNAELRQLLEEKKRRSEGTVQDIQEINEALQTNVGKLENENRRLKENVQKEKEHLKKLEEEHGQRRNIMTKEMEKLQQEIISLKANLGQHDVRSSRVDSRVNKKLNAEKDIQQQLKDTMDQLKQVQKELDDTKSRLSRAMGDRLTDNNPNIADLSDKNRPTKISERYQELYDNQWTDAFEKVNEKYGNEEKTIDVLNDILMDTLKFCKTQAANQMIQIRASFLKGEDLPENMKKQVKECRKAMAELYGKGLYREYCDQLRTSKPESMSTPSYVKECFEICWLMAVQDPPVEFGPDLHRGDTFNKEHYRAYTRSGERVDFVVWPVLLLHQNGPVLCKGVAQGK